MHRNPKELQKKYRTYGKSRAVRLPDYDYAQDIPTHLTICAKYNLIQNENLPRIICPNVEFYCKKLQFELYGYCMMPDHLHVLLSSAKSGTPVSKWLDSFKSFTTHEYMRAGGKPPLWQLSAHDHVCRAHESASNVVMYIANNPVRVELVKKWDDWPWTRIFIDA